MRYVSICDKAFWQQLGTIVTNVIGLLYNTAAAGPVFLTVSLVGTADSLCHRRPLPFGDISWSVRHHQYSSLGLVTFDKN